MALTTETVNGTLYYPDGTAISGAFVTFTLSYTGTSSADSGTIPPTHKQVTTDGTGGFSIGLWPNELSTTASNYTVSTTFTDATTGKEVHKRLGKIQVPSTGGPHTLSELLEAGEISAGAFYLGIITQSQYDAIIAAQEEVEQAIKVVNIQTDDTGGAKTLALTDSGGILELGGTTDWTVTIPTNASVAFPVGSLLNITRTGTAEVNIVADTGVTLNGVFAGTTSVDIVWKGVALYKRSVDDWVVQGAYVEVTV